jgi:nucleotide-binding universal stress UspA family protein
VDRLGASVDGTPTSEEVLPIATGWAIALEMRLSIVTVAEDAPIGLSGTRPNRFGPEDPQAYVDGLAGQWRQVVPGTTGEVVLDPIGPVTGLRNHLTEHPAGCVAVSTSARSGFDRLRLGAMAADIVAASTVPTLVCPLAEA